MILSDAPAFLFQSTLSNLTEHDVQNFLRGLLCIGMGYRLFEKQSHPFVYASSRNAQYPLYAS